MAAGRLTPEKGLLDLVKMWPTGRELLLAGDGPESDEIRAWVKPRPEIRFVGQLSRTEIRQRLLGAVGVVFPSKWPEVAPQVVAEAACAGLPVVSFRSALIHRDVERAGMGFSYESADELGESLDAVERNHSRLSASARAHYETSLSPSVWLSSMSALYHSMTSGPYE